MTGIDLLPLPEVNYVDDEGLWEEHGPYSREQMQDYARANVARNTALLRAEIKALRESLTALEAENEKLRESLKEAENELDWLSWIASTGDRSV